MPDRTCHVDNCDKPRDGRSRWCGMHRARLRRNGSFDRHQPAWPSDATCAVANCGKPRRTREWCGTHYARWLKIGDVRADIPLRRNNTPGCSIEGCEGKHSGQGYCAKHHSRWRKYGDPHFAKQLKGATPFERIWRWVDKSPEPDGCWTWTSSVNGYGYGDIQHKGSHNLVHRVAYEGLIGPIPDGLTLDHLCRNKRCCNPAHLEPVTNRVNILRSDSVSAVNARKTHCIRNHEFTGANTHITPEGHRRCRECMRMWTEKAKARR